MNEIRILRPDSIDPLILKIEKESFDFPWRTDVPFRRYLSKDQFFVIYFNGSLAGYLLIAFVNDEISIVKMAIDSEYQGLGLAKELLNKAHEIGQAKNAKSIVLSVRKSNAKAIRFYKKYGFTQVKEICDYYKKTNHESALKMKFAIAPQDIHDGKISSFSNS